MKSIVYWRSGEDAPVYRLVVRDGAVIEARGSDGCDATTVFRQFFHLQPGARRDIEIATGAEVATERATWEAEQERRRRVYEERHLAPFLEEIRKGVTAMLLWCSERPGERAPHVDPGHLDNVAAYAGEVRGAIVEREARRQPVDLPPVAVVLEAGGGLSFAWKWAA